MRVHSRFCACTTPPRLCLHGVRPLSSVILQNLPDSIRLVRCLDFRHATSRAGAAKQPYLLLLHPVLLPAEARSVPWECDCPRCTVATSLLSFMACLARLSPQHSTASAAGGGQIEAGVSPLPLWLLKPLRSPLLLLLSCCPCLAGPRLRCHLLEAQASVPVADAALAAKLGRALRGSVCARGPGCRSASHGDLRSSWRCAVCVWVPPPPHPRLPPRPMAPCACLLSVCSPTHELPPSKRVPLPPPPLPHTPHSFRLLHLPGKQHSHSVLVIRTLLGHFLEHGRCASHGAAAARKQSRIGSADASRRRPDYRYEVRSLQASDYTRHTQIHTLKRKMAQTFALAGLQLGRF